MPHQDLNIRLDQSTNDELSQHSHSCISVAERENNLTEGKAHTESVKVLHIENTTQMSVESPNHVHLEEL